MNREIDKSLDEVLDSLINEPNRDISDEEYESLIEAIAPSVNPSTTEEPETQRIQEAGSEVDEVTGACAAPQKLLASEEILFEPVTLAKEGETPEQVEIHDDHEPMEILIVPENELGSATRKKGGVSARLKEFFDPKVWPSDLEEIDSSARWPKKIYIGFLSGVKKKDLIGYINEWIMDNDCSRSACSYQTMAWNGGFAFEIHEGGTGKGCLQSALKALNEHDEIVIPSSDRSIRLSKRFDGFASYFLNEFETFPPPESVVFKDPMTPVYKRNHGLMVTGLVAGLFSTVFLFGSWFTVYTIYDKDKVPVFTQPEIEMPSRQISKIADISSRDDAYLKALTYSVGKWKISLETVSPPTPEPTVAPEFTPDDQPSAPNSEQPVAPAVDPTLSPQASMDKEIIRLHQDLVNTLAESQE